MRRYCYTCGAIVTGKACPQCGDTRKLTDTQLERLRLAHSDRGKVARKRGGSI